MNDIIENTKDKVIEISNDISTTLKDRMNNPIIPTFFLILLGYNWKSILILLFSEKSIEDKLSYIKQYNSFINLKIFNLPIDIGISILLSLFYILGLPFVCFYIEKLLSNNNIRRYELKLKEARAKTALDTQQDTNEYIEQLKNKINTLDEQLKSKENEYNDKFNVLEKNYISSVKEYDRKEELNTKRYTDLQNQYNNILNQLNSAKNSLNEKDAEIQNLKSSNLNNEDYTQRVITFEDGNQLYEYKSSSNAAPTFYDILTKQPVEYFDAMGKMGKMNYTIKVLK